MSTAVATHDLTQIQGELARRELFRFFVDAWPMMDPAAFCPTWHLEALCEFLQYVSTGDIKRLIVSMPPRMTKSLSCSVAWPVWEWIDRPKTQFLTSSYDGALSPEKRESKLIARLVYGLYKGDFSVAFNKASGMISSSA